VPAAQPFSESYTHSEVRFKAFFGFACLVASSFQIVNLSERTISRWMKRAPRGPDRAKRWLAFLRNHREAIAAMDFFTVPTVTFGVLYCFFIISHDCFGKPHEQWQQGASTKWAIIVR
jgi:hypothetical protein